MLHSTHWRRWIWICKCKWICGNLNLKFSAITHAFKTPLKVGLLFHLKSCFFKNHAENEVEKLVPDLFLFFKALYKAKASSLQLGFTVFR